MCGTPTGSRPENHQSTLDVMTGIGMSFVDRKKDLTQQRGATEALKNRKSTLMSKPAPATPFHLVSKSAVARMHATLVYSVKK